MGTAKVLVLIVVVAVIILVSNSLFTVDERQKVIMFEFGEIVKDDFAPGIHWKIPVMNNVRKFDNRILTLDSDPEAYLTLAKKNVIVDSFVKWRIKDVARFFTANSGDEVVALNKLSQIIKNGLRDEFGKRTIQEVVSGERNQIMEVLQVKLNKQVAELGMEIVDVRLKRIDFPDKISQSVYERMEAERKRVANDTRSRGAEAAERIQADADRQRTILLAEAYRDSEQIRGEGDSKAADIYAKAYNKNPEFYSLYRSLTAYKNSFSERSDILVVKPDSDFFKYFTNSNPESNKKSK
ncbi:MAG: protease modulator HflC [Gammaproteobacteria bacterium]|nr:protease modulator HflC [Gammaproteobacteria bacterium]